MTVKCIGPGQIVFQQLNLVIWSYARVQFGPWPPAETREEAVCQYREPECGGIGTRVTERVTNPLL